MAKKNKEITYKFKVTYKTYGSEVLPYDLKQEDEVVLEVKDENLSFYNAMVNILDTKMAPEGYESVNDFYYKTGNSRQAEALVWEMPDIISKVMCDVYYVNIERIQ